MEIVDSKRQLLLVAGLILVGYIAYALLIGLFSTQAKYLRSTAWAGQQERWFAHTRTGLDAFKNLRTMAIEAYNKFSRNNLPFVLPMFAHPAMVVLPASKIDTLLQKPDSNVNVRILRNEFTQVKYSGDAHVVANPLHFNVVRNQLTRKLPLLTADVYDELARGFKDRWPAKQGEWTSVGLYETVIKIVSRAANRVFCGEDLCRNEEFLNESRIYTQTVFGNALVISFIPALLRPVIAPLISLSTKWRLRRCMKHCLPVVQKRVERLNSSDAKPETSDAIQWLIEETIKQTPGELDVVLLTRRILRLNMAAIHATGISMTNCILDLYSSPDVDVFLEGLREECERVLGSDSKQWTKSALNSLVRVDSAIKETIRLSSITPVVMQGVITAKNGVDLGDGIHIPEGIRVGFGVDAIHRDPAHYARADAYNPFRFSDMREQPPTEGAAGILKQKNQNLTTTHEHFLSFGHGRHACPGRFFASLEMKLMLAYLIMNYDIKPLQRRPKNMEIGPASLPDPTTTVDIRLR